MTSYYAPRPSKEGIPSILALMSVQGSKKGASILTIGFCGPVYYDCNNEPAKIV